MLSVLFFLSNLTIIEGDFRMDKQAVIMQHILETWSCFMCAKLGLKEKCVKAGKGCNNTFLENEIRKIFKAKREKEYFKRGENN